MTHSPHTVILQMRPCGSAHLLYQHCRCEIADNVDFLFQPHTLSSYCRCSSSDTVHFLLTLHNLLFRLHDFLLVLHTFSLCIADMTFLTLQTFPQMTHPVFLLQMFPFYTVHYLLMPQNPLLVLQMRPSWH